MITREQYMSNSSELHQAYYAQFVTKGTIQQVGGYIGVDKIVGSTDPYFNDIPLHRWDRLADYLCYNAIAFKLATGSSSYSCSDMVCIAKAAARIIKTTPIEQPTT